MDARSDSTSPGRSSRTRHRALAASSTRWADARRLPARCDHERRRCGLPRAGRARSARRLAAGRACRPRTAGCIRALDVRSLCLLRETLASATGSPISPSRCRASAPARSRWRHAELKQRYLPRSRDGEAIAAFALSEPEAGSDVAAMADDARRRRRRTGALDGDKTWISNGGIADLYVVFARTGEAPGAQRTSAFVVDADTPGLDASPSAST